MTVINNFDLCDPDVLKMFAAAEAINHFSILIVYECKMLNSATVFLVESSRKKSNERLDTCRFLPLFISNFTSDSFNSLKLYTPVCFIKNNHLNYLFAKLDNFYYFFKLVSVGLHSYAVVNHNHKLFYIIIQASKLVEMLDN